MKKKLKITAVVLCAVLVLATVMLGIALACTPNITDTNGNNLETMQLVVTQGQLRSTNPGGLLFWVTGSPRAFGRWFTIDPALPVEGHFALQNNHSVQIIVGGQTVYNGASLSSQTVWVPAGAEVVLRIHARYAQLQPQGYYPHTYTFSADASWDGVGPGSWDWGPVTYSDTVNVVW